MHTRRVVGRQSLFQVLFPVVLLGRLGTTVIPFAHAQQPTTVQDAPVTIHVLDVGDGASALIETPRGKWAVIDGGPSGYLADSAIPRYGVDRFALAVLSHSHSDHLRGLLPALDRIPTDRLVADMPPIESPSIRQFWSLIQKKRILVEKPSLDTINIDGIRFIIIPPPFPVTGEQPNVAENNRSIIVRLEYGRFSMLFPGDAQERQRQWLIDSTPELLRSSILQASHHGSVKGTSPDWIDAVSPSAVVIPVGNKQFGSVTLPYKYVVDMYAAQVGESRVYCTKRQGTILIFGYPNGRSSVRPERERRISCADSDTLPVAVAADTLIDHTALYIIPFDTGRRERLLRPRFRANDLEFVQGKRAYTGSFHLWLIDPTAEHRKGKLDDPVLAQLSSSDEVNPTVLVFDHINVPYKVVTVTRRIPGDSARVHVIPDNDPTGFTVALPVRQTILAEVAPKKIQGFGLQTSDVTVQLQPGFLDSVEVTVVADQGTVVNRRVMVYRGRSQDVTVRSAGVGTDSIRINSQASHDVIVVVYRWPVVFLVAALLGGCVGVFARQRRRNARPLGAREVLNGVLVGLIAAVGFALGVNLLKMPIEQQGFSEAAVFLIAALATYSGVSLTAKTQDR